MADSIKIKIPKDDLGTLDSRISVILSGDGLEIKGLQHGENINFFCWDMETKSKFYVGHGNQQLAIGTSNGLKEAVVKKHLTYRGSAGTHRNGSLNIEYLLDGKEGKLYLGYPALKAPSWDEYDGRHVQLQMLPLPKDTETCR